MIVTKDMSISAQEFARTLRRFAKDAPLIEAAPGRWRMGGAEISLKALPPLRIAALELERHRVTIDLSGLPKAQAKAFLESFDLSFHRGGG